MKLVVLIGVCISICQTVAVSTDMKQKMPTKLANTISASQKPELLYSQGNQQSQADFVQVPVMQKPFYVAQQPQTMLIIAQPALVPQNVLFGGQPTMQQQLLNYFHGNPQAKYQLLYGGYQPQPTTQTYVTQAHMGASTVPAYQVVPNPVFTGAYNHLIAAPSQVSYNQASFPTNQLVQQVVQPQAYQQQAIQPQAFQQQAVQPMQLNQIAQLAQLAAQQFGVPLRTAPPIITGLENFTPEQQSQIKAQLGAHLGAPAATAATIPASTSQYSTQLTTQPTQSLSSNDYAQNQDKSGAQASSTSYSPSLMYRGQYTKG